MKRFFSLSFFLILLFTLPKGIFAQNLSLQLRSLKQKNQAVLDSLYDKKDFKTKKKIDLAVTSILNRLKKKGYFTTRLVDFKNESNTFYGVIDLGEKTNFLVVTFTDNQKKLLNLKESQKKIPIEELDLYKKSLKDLLLSKGVPFSEIVFINYRFLDTNLNVELSIKQSKKRKIDKIIVKGYEKFPKSFIKNYLQLKKTTKFSSSLIQEIEKKIENLSFVKSAKKPEVLFKKDSTILYIHLKKERTNTLDALVNLATDTNNSLQFNGIVDLSLTNVLNAGEAFSFYWNRVATDQSEFDVKTHIPYLLNTKLSTQLTFNIYRQDSTFLNTTANFSFSYPIKDRISVGLHYQTTSSNQVNENLLDANLNDFSKNILGVYIQLSSSKRAFNKTKLLEQLYRVSYGSRKANESISQFLFESQITSNIELSKKSLIHIRNTTQLLFSPNYLQNELFRIGGINSIRSFNEQSIFSSKNSLINLEYQYYTSASSYLHTITDFAWTQDILAQNQYLYALGLGYAFQQKNSQIHLGYVVGGETGTAIDLNNSRLVIKFLTIF